MDGCRAGWAQSGGQTVWLRPLQPQFGFFSRQVVAQSCWRCVPCLLAASLLWEKSSGKVSWLVVPRSLQLRLRTLCFVVRRLALACTLWGLPWLVPCVMARPGECVSCGCDVQWSITAASRAIPGYAGPPRGVCVCVCLARLRLWGCMLGCRHCLMCVLLAWVRVWVYRLVPFEYNQQYSGERKA